MPANTPDYQREYMRRYRRRIRGRIRQQLGGHCVKCFTVKYLHVHHIIPVFRDPDSNKTDCFNDLIKTWKAGKGGLYLKCGKCHSEQNGNGYSLVEKSLPVRTDRLLRSIWRKHENKNDKIL